MRLHWIPFVVVILYTFALDYFIARKAMRSRHRLYKSLGWSNAALSVLTFVAVVWAFATMPHDKASFISHMALSARVLLAYFVVNVPKWLWGIFVAVGNIKRLPAAVAQGFKCAGSLVFLVTLLVMLQGSFITPRTINVNRVAIEHPSLPPQFQGYRIVHISDVHLGNFGGDTTVVSKCVDSINSLNPDVVCFTGDLVSMTVDEVAPFVGVLSRINARDGVYSVLGNHDYAHYMRMLTPEQQQADVDSLCQVQRALGWTLLNNSHATINRGSDSIAIVGTDNYGDPPFPVYGDYGKATQGLDGVFKIHLQHNPYMWQKALVGKTDAQLTLSGHTHAMQCVVALGDSWSPAQWRYNEWGGLYSAVDQHLYVNTGLGTVGPPLRIGVPPEVTLIILNHTQ